MMIRKMLEQEIYHVTKGRSAAEHREGKCRGAFGLQIISSSLYAFSRKFDKSSVLIQRLHNSYLILLQFTRFQLISMLEERGKTSLGTLELALVKHTASKQHLACRDCHLLQKNAVCLGFVVDEMIVMFICIFAV